MLHRHQSTAGRTCQSVRSTSHVGQGDVHGKRLHQALHLSQNSLRQRWFCYSMSAVKPLFALPAIRVSTVPLFSHDATKAVLHLAIVQSSVENTLHVPLDGTQSIYAYAPPASDDLSRHSSTRVEPD